MNVKVGHNYLTGLRQMWSNAPVLAAPEPVYAKPRPMTGFLASLNDEQKEKALAYCGEENHGDDTYESNR